MAIVVFGGLVAIGYSEAEREEKNGMQLSVKILFAFFLGKEYIDVIYAFYWNLSQKKNEAK